MSERMTDEEFKARIAGATLYSGKWSLAMDEAERARASEVEKDAEIAAKDAKIKALADALIQVRLMVPWVKDESTTTGQMIAHALRLAGRL